MRVRTILPLLLLMAMLALAWQLVPWTILFQWTIQMQREFQDAMARALRAVQAGDPAAVAGLCAATALYGVVHAAGPGHGKVLIGGAALASGATFRRMAVLTLASSLAQAATAIALIGALALVLRMGAMRVGHIADSWLAPASYVAIAAIGGLLIFRGVKMMRTSDTASRKQAHSHDHGHGACGCGHAHGPTADQVASLSSWRDAAALVVSIALRPCTGALFLLAIALRLDLFWTGALAVMTMGLGTAAFNLTIAGSGVMARRLAMFGAEAGDVRALSAGAHVLGGGLIVALSLAWLLQIA
ncbi:MAG: hypothetical protein AAF919_11370 [Pseudomonadota bacterium]